MNSDSTRAAVEALGTLVAFDTTSRNSNRDLIGWVRQQAEQLGARCRLTFNAQGNKANALLSFGPDAPGGIVLSGHTDVVPVDDQAWTVDPFRMSEKNGRLYGRGTADMKGFIACCLVAMHRWSELPLQVPLHIALSFDEEVGCLGVPLLIRDFLDHVPSPAFVLVGEPTGMRLATSHKGFCLFRTAFKGTEAHSSLAHRGVSAISAAVRFANYLLETGILLAYRESRVIQQLPRHTTFNLGLIDGGTAINIIPAHCALTWEFRPVPEEDVQAIKSRVEAFLRDGLAREFGLQTGKGIEHELLLEVPPLHEDARSLAVRQIASLLKDESVTSLPFGSEAGFFANAGPD